MIDTDKYEGHTEGPWSDKTELYWVTEEDDGSYQVEIDHKPNKLLIHDAPKLLAEVKRLNGIIDYIRYVGRIEKRKEVSTFFLSIMEKVLTLEEYEEWISECK